MSDAPPPPNPVLTAYENFLRETPLVTRFIITSQFATWVLSFFVDLSFALANILHFTIFKFEIYRIVLSPFICPGFISLVFAYISFTENGRRLEFSMGSTSFGGLLLTLGCLTNVAHLLVCFLFYVMTGKETFLFLPAMGIWIILFAVIAIDCVKAPRNSMRKLFFATVPTIYYPLALFALFSLLGGFQISYLLSIGVGYAYGLGHLDKLKISDSRYRQWEETILENFAQREGWISAQNAMGSASWYEDQSSPSRGGGGFDFLSRLSPQPSTSSNQPQGRQDVERGEIPPPSDPPVQSFPTGGGRQLGTAERRHASDPRQARLQALEKRAAEENTTANSGDKK